MYRAQFKYEIIFIKFNQILRDHQMILIVELDLFGSSKNLGLLLLNTVPLSK